MTGNDSLFSSKAGALRMQLPSPSQNLSSLTENNNHFRPLVPSFLHDTWFLTSQIFNVTTKRGTERTITVPI